MSQQRHSQFVLQMTRHDQAIRRYLFTLLFDGHAVDEVMQETALTLWEKFADYDPTQSFLPWACTFAYFKVLERRRQENRDRLVFRPEVLELVSETARQRESEAADRAEALTQCLSLLHEPDRELLRRRYVDGERVVDLAPQLGKDVKHLYNRIDRLRHQLARCVRLRLAESCHAHTR